MDENDESATLRGSDRFSAVAKVTMRSTVPGASLHFAVALDGIGLRSRWSTSGEDFRTLQATRPLPKVFLCAARPVYSVSLLPAITG